MLRPLMVGQQLTNLQTPSLTKFRAQLESTLDPLPMQGRPSPLRQLQFGRAG
ncbi:hypothetical protein JOD69_004535 [Methylocaldum sp. RMAD-M]|nr:hypothetical protein [Methylocaldum sp. RMAD-M]